ncbi:MAG: hypothetical protein R2708_27205 [Vicinamibacterales bacterium]
MKRAEAQKTATVLPFRPRQPDPPVASPEDRDEVTVVVETAGPSFTISIDVTPRPPTHRRP